jgi:hypothetical protein
LSRRIIVHSLAQASAAVDAAAALAVPLTLMSAPAAGCYAGPAWFKALVDHAAARHPDVAVAAIIDCADEPGAVLAALRTGFKRVRYTGDTTALDRLRSMAEAYDAAIETGAPATTLDLLDRPDAVRLCRDYLAEDAAASSDR